MTALVPLSEHGIESTQVEEFLRRYHAGDADAIHQLYLHCATRFRLLARKMLRKFPVVRRWEQTDDVLQSALVRLQRAITSTKITTVKDLMRLTSTNIRRELIDLSRHYQGKESMYRKHYTPQSRDDLLRFIADSKATDKHLQSWENLHLAINELEPEYQQLFDLIWYQGAKITGAARILHEPYNDVKRRWQAAKLALLEISGQDFLN